MNTPISVRLPGMLRIVMLLFALVAAAAVPAFAIDFESARAAGLVGEVDNGFVAIPPSAKTQETALVTAVNNERRAVYAEIAAKNGTSIEVAALRTFEKRYPSFPAGTWIQIQGKWTRK